MEELIEELHFMLEDKKDTLDRYTYMDSVNEYQDGYNEGLKEECQNTVWELESLIERLEKTNGNRNGSDN